MVCSAHANEAPAVVTDARLRTAVTAIRSLGQKGIKVHAAESGGLNRVLGFSSRYVKNKIPLSKEAHKQPDGKDLAAILGACVPKGVILPIHSPFVFMLSERKQKLSQTASFLVPEYASLKIAHDKWDCMKLARSLRIPVPGTWALEQGTELEKWLEGLKLAYPVILKYRSGEDLWLSADKRTVKCSSPHEVSNQYRKMHAIQKEPVIQEYVEGSDWGAALLYDSKSRLIAWFTYRSIRERPPGRGPTVYAESVYKPELVDLSHRLLSSLKWKGIAMVDFRQGTDGRFRLLEVNPRFWGSLALAVHSGVDFPFLYYRAALGLSTEASQQKDGVKIRFFPQDLLSVIDYARKDGNSVLPALGREIVEKVKHRSKDGLLDLADPLPGLSYLFEGLVSRAAGRDTT